MRTTIKNCGVLAGGILLGIVASAIAQDQSSFGYLADQISLPAVILLVGISTALALLLYLDRSKAARQPVGTLPPQSFSQTGTEAAEINSVRSELERQLGRFFILITRQIEASMTRANALARANEKLEAVTTVHELRAAINELVASNNAGREDMSELEAQLTEARAQAASLRQRLSQAERLAQLDPLTGLANRRRFDEVLAAEVNYSHEQGTPLCLMMADIDHFKVVNDTFGHRTGDAVLREFSAVLQSHVRSTDLVARYGGEEFAVVLPRAALGSAYEIAERIRIALGQRSWSHHGEPLDLKLTSSFGIAEIREDEVLADLIMRADKKLYEAKAGGRNCTMVWSSAA